MFSGTVAAITLVGLDFFLFQKVETLLQRIAEMSDFSQTNFVGTYLILIKQRFSTCTRKCSKFVSFKFLENFTKTCFFTV